MQQSSDTSRPRIRHPQLMAYIHSLHPKVAPAEHARATAAPRGLAAQLRAHHGSHGMFIGHCSHYLPLWHVYWKRAGPQLRDENRTSPSPSHCFRDDGSSLSRRDARMLRSMLPPCRGDSFYKFSICPNDTEPDTETVLMHGTLLLVPGRQRKPE